MRYVRTMLVACFAAVTVSSYAQAPPTTYEQVLVPLDTVVLPGAGGALWSAELRVRNSADIPVNLFPESCSFIGRQFPCDQKILVAPQTTQLLDVLNFSSPSVPGVMLYVPSNHKDDIHFTLNLRDTRSQDTVGTTIPVVRQNQFRSRLTIIGVPIAPGHRRSLRVYEPHLPPQSVFRVRVIDEAANRVLVDREYSQSSRSDPPSPVLVPAAFDFSDSLTAAEVQTAERVTVSIERVFPETLTLWSLISVTSTDNRVAIFVPN